MVSGTAREGIAATPAPLEFRAVYERWVGDVSRWIQGLGSPQAYREDLVQDVFLVVQRRLPYFDGPKENLPAWLYRIARRRVRDFRRLAWVRHTLFAGEPVSESLAGRGVAPDASLETKEKQATLRLLLGELNESERAAVVLFDIDGYKGEEIAAIQGVPSNTVWARIHKARKKLRAALARHERQKMQASNFA